MAGPTLRKRDNRYFDNMQVFYGFDELKRPEKPSAVTVGVFDGVHIGHQKIIKLTIKKAKELGGSSICVTFDRHPLELLKPGSHPQLLSTLEDKILWIGNLGVDILLVVKFDEHFASLSPQEFVDNVLIESLNASVLIVGGDFFFGRHREGDIGFLESYGPTKGLEIQAVPLVYVGNIPASSTKIRRSLKEGNIALAAELLGRLPVIKGKVVRGKGRGGTLLGYPTANVEAEEKGLVPGNGVYAGYAQLDGRRYPCVIDVGVMPTFADVLKQELHVHVLGFEGLLYGKTIKVELLKRIRDEKAFASEDELAKQIRQDIEIVEKELSRGQ